MVRLLCAFDLVVPQWSLTFAGSPPDPLAAEPCPAAGPHPNPRRRNPYQGVGEISDGNHQSR
ncbi:MAG: hypothetical protein L0332_20825 [Chloroflexi bacterium]|nr:hypothetical protein [Chloroflexota bacterium]MCI0577219.1 hypothetical protein [Chloroflexota bacterium]MCI0647510.1 hypothetical protein [Chloroflexota bacterium]MCI0729142.1 hypothetical protein [Chloroflexota bacterium]